MINERQFSFNFSNFWRTSLPNLEAVLRALNLGCERIQRPLVPQTDPQRRDLISETGFRLAASKWRGGRIEASDVSAAYESAVSFLVAEAELAGAGSYPPLNADEQSEVLEICRRIGEFIRHRSPRLVRFFPEFPGMGLLGRCYGDMVIDSTVVEVKYVDRAFRSTDLKQAITYAALGSTSDKTGFDNIISYNPLRGTYIESEFYDLIFGASGRTVEDFKFDFMDALSGPGISR